MPAELTAFPLNDDQVEYGWTCNECRKQRAGMAQAYALNSLAKHNREQHAEPSLDLTAAAKVVLAAWVSLQSTETDALAGEATLVRRNRARAEYALVLSTWAALTGLDDGAALRFARACARQEVAAHVAPL